VAYPPPDEETHEIFDDVSRSAFAGGKYSVTDGPFPETKELIDGFALIKANSMAEAIELAKRFMAVAGEGEGEILQVFDGADIPG
jgi:hypothetical protein